MRRLEVCGRVREQIVEQHVIRQRLVEHIGVVRLVYYFASRTRTSRVDVEWRARLEQVTKSLQMLVSDAQVSELGGKQTLNDHFDLVRVGDETRAARVRHGSQDGGVAYEQVDQVDAHLMEKRR